MGMLETGVLGAVDGRFAGPHPAAAARARKDRREKDCVGFMTSNYN
jgi:hypothetical protein